MNNRIRFLVSFVIMIITILGMGINFLVFSMPDWTVRTIGIVMLVDLMVLVYSRVRMNQKENIEQ